MCLWFVPIIKCTMYAMCYNKVQSSAIIVLLSYVKIQILVLIIVLLVAWSANTDLRHMVACISSVSNFISVKFLCESQILNVIIFRCVLKA